MTWAELHAIADKAMGEALREVTGADPHAAFANFVDRLSIAGWRIIEEQKQALAASGAKQEGSTDI